MVPIWVNPNQGVTLNPPAEVLKLGELPRAPEKVLGAYASLALTEAKRYQPLGGRTWCNIALADAMAILRAAIPHRFDLLDGKGLRELRANDIVDGLRAGKFKGWTKTGSIASAEAVRALARDGKPQVAVWKNNSLAKPSDGKTLIGTDGKPVLNPGHVVGVVAAPAVIPEKHTGLSGVYVSGAGAQCLHQCPIEQAFGPYLSGVEFFAYDDP